MPIADDIRLDRLNQPLAPDDNFLIHEWTPLIGLECERRKVTGLLASSQTAQVKAMNEADRAETEITVLAAELSKIDAAIEALKKAFPDWAGEQKREG